VRVAARGGPGGPRRGARPPPDAPPPPPAHHPPPRVSRGLLPRGPRSKLPPQNPIDIPDTVLGQLGNRVQHALRAYTPRDQKAVLAAADTFRANPGLKVQQVITELGVGEALVSFLDEKGRPSIVERATVCPPNSQIGPITPDQRKILIQNSLVAGQYEKTVDRESAYEKLKARRGDAAAPSPEAGHGGGLGGMLDRIGLPSGGTSKREGVVEAAVKSAARAMASEAGRRIMRGVLGSILGGRK